MPRNSLRALQWLNVLAFVAVVAVNALASLLPLNGVTPDMVSDRYPNLFTPAEFTFAIWGAIYLLLFAFTLYQTGLFGARVSGSLDAVQRLGILFFLSSLFNIAWIFCWHYQRIPLSMIAIVGLLICLALADERITAAPLNGGETLFVRLPFEFYFGWVTVATIGNAATLLVALGWDGFGLAEPIWATILLIVGLVIGLSVILNKHAWAYGLAMAWAYLGILVRHLSPDGFGSAYPLVLVTAAVGLALLLGASFLALFRPREEPAPPREA